MNIETLKKACTQYEELEGRASFYDIASEIAEEHPLQASIIILATWNVSRFRFVVSENKNLTDLVKGLDICTPLFEQLKDETFIKTDFEKIRVIVENIYTTLSVVKGVEYTGTSKVMHLLNRNLFVMWDGYIRSKYGFGTRGKDYVDFLKEMQEEFRNIAWDEPTKTLPKAIDEFNYVIISLPALREKRKRESKR